MHRICRHQSTTSVDGIKNHVVMNYYTFPEYPVNISASEYAKAQNVIMRVDARSCSNYCM